MNKTWADEYFQGQPPVVTEGLELVSFRVAANCAPWPFPDSLKVEYSNVFYQAIFKIIAEAGIPKGSLSFTSPEQALEINKTKGDRTMGWFGIGYQEPGRSFGITVDDQVFQIRCDDIRLGDLVVLAGDTFSRITEAWMSPGLAEPVLLKDRVHTVDYMFKFRLRLGNDKVQQKQVKNYKLLTEALSLDRKPKPKGGKAVSDAFPSIGTEEYIRMDYTQHALKTIDGQKFNTGIVIEAPFNEANSTLHVTAFLRAEEEFGFDLNAALKWDTALVSFLRDIVLKRFMDNLLCSTEYTNL